MASALRPHRWFILLALVVVLVVGALIAALTDTPAEIRLREQLGLDAPCLPQTEDSPGWRAEPRLPGPLDEARAVELDGDVYIAGGTDKLLEYGRPSDVPGVREYVRAHSLDQFLRFDPRTGRYKRMAPMPERLNHVVMAAYGGRIYVAGGLGDLLFGADTRSDVFEYDPEHDSWRSLRPMPTPRGAASGAVIDGKLYVAGGITNNGRISTALEAYDFRTGRWESLPAMPTAREHAAGTAHQGYLYVLGGRTLTSDSIDVVERYDPANRRWRRARPLPQDAGSFDAASVGDYLVAVAGDDDREGWVTGAVQRYDPASNSWTQLPEMRTPRHGFAAAVAGDRLWTFGGSPCARFAASDFAESFDLGLVAR